MNFSNLAQSDKLAQLLIEKRMLTRREFLAKIGQHSTDVESNAALEGGSNGRSIVRR